MKRKTLIVIGAGTAVAVALLAWAFAPRPLEVEVAQADRGRFETTIAEDGRTRLRERFVVAAPLAGQLARIPWRAGDRVEAGTVLATLAPLAAPMIDARSRSQLAARVDAAQAQQRRAAASVESARVALAQARQDRQRSQALQTQGFVAAARADADALALRAAEAGLDAASAARRMADHELAQAQAALAVSAPDAETRQRFAVKAPVGGRVLRVLQASATTVALGTPLLEIGDTAQLEIVAELLTADALRVVPGADVRVERWGGAQDLAGRVRAVEPAAFTKVSALGVEEQRVNVLIDLTTPADQWQALGDGYRVGVAILTRRVEDALRVPVSAVFPLPAPAEAGRFGVFVIDGDKARLKPVRVGARNGQHAWIEEGLAAGATVIIYPPVSLSDGMRVRARTI